MKSFPVTAPLAPVISFLRGIAVSCAVLCMGLDASAGPVGPIITASKSAAPATPLPAGSTITYTTVLSNTGSSDATGVNYSDNLDVLHTSSVAGTLSATPVAVDDFTPAAGLTVQANIGIDTSISSFSVLTNDFLGYSGGSATTLATITIAVGTSPAHGTLTSLTTSGAGIGQFVYSPNAGYVGTDSFTYTISNGVGAINANTTGTVNLNVTGPVVWFVDNSGANGNGTLSSPFNNLASAQSASAAGDIIYVAAGSGSYTGGITLKANQQLIGNGVALIVGSNTIKTAGSSPTITNAGGNGVTLSTGNTLSGFTLGNSSGSALAGTGFGTLTVSSVSINTNKQALSLTTGSFAAGAAFSSITSSGGTNNILLSGVTGTVALGSGTLNGATGDGFKVSGGTATTSYSGSITGSTGAHSVNIASETGGTISLSGAVTENGSGTGISLSGNTGATINFTGTITASTGAATAFSATGGGTVSATDANNALTTTTATALIVANTTIGAGGLTFRSITAGTGASGPVNGIVLNNTGASGGLTVTGNGPNNGTGGTIQRTTGDGISLTGTSNVSLTSVRILNTAANGINGTTVTNFSFVNGTIDTCGTSGTQSNIAFDSSPTTATNITGTFTVTGSTLNNAYFSGIDIQCGAGTISNATISNNSITSSTIAGASLGQGINIVGVGSAGACFNLTKATIANNTIRNFPSGAGVQVNVSNANASGPGCTVGIPNDATHIVSITGNTIQGQSSLVPFGTNAIIYSVSGANSGSRSQGNFDISSNGTLANPVTNMIGTAMLLGVNGDTTCTGTCNNNVINCNHDASNQLGGNGIGGGSGVTTGNTDTPSFTLTVDGNTISNTDGNGILLVARGVTSTSNFKISNNTVATPLAHSGAARDCIRVDSGNASSGNETLSLNVIGNIVANGANGLGSIGLRKQGTVVNVNTFGLKNISQALPTNAQVQTFVAGQNTCAGTVDIISGSNFVQLNTAPLMFSQGGVEHSVASADTAAMQPVQPADAPPSRVTTSVAPSSLQPVTSSQTEAPGVITQADLDIATSSAVARWEATGLTADQVAVLRKLSFEAADLPTLRLGEASGNHIRVSRNAGGNGWFTDATSQSDAKFYHISSATRRYTDPAGLPAGRIDLLTAIMHEMGHTLGLEDTYLQSDRDSLMYGFLTVGERRSPSIHQAAGVKPTPEGGMHFLTASINVGTLPAGKSVTISYQAQIENPITGGATQVSSQGSVSGTNFTSPVLTDDPSVGGSADPTVTALAIPPVVTTNPSNQTVVPGGTATFTAAASGSPTPTLQWQVSTDGGANFTNVTGATSSPLSFTAASGDNAKQYRAVFTNVASTATTTAATLTVASPPTITKVFSASSIPVNGTTSLTFTITNPNTSLALNGISFTDNLPAGLVVATPGNLISTLGGTATAVDGSGSIGLSGCTLAGGASGTITIDVQGTTAGVKNNSVQVTSANAGTGNTSNASITVVSAPVIIQAFGAASIPLNGSTSLTFTVQNNNTTTTLTGIGFTETLPAGLVISTPNGQSGTAGGGTITATQGTNVISVTGATLAQSSSFTFSVNVTGTAPGTQNAVTGAITSTEGGTGGTASASVDVVAPPSIAAAFGAANIPLNGTTSLTFTITNPSGNAVALTGVAFTNTLPAGLVVATPNGLSSTAGGTATAVAGSGSISLTGGTIAANSSATVTVNVTGTTSGSKSNTSGAVSATNGGTGNTATASLAVGSPPSITKVFGASNVPVNGSTSLTFTITNPNSNMTLTGISFTDNLPAGLAVATPNGLSSTLGGTATAVAGLGSISLSGCTLAANASGTITVNVTGTTAGVKNNSVQVTSTEGGNGNTSNASITVVAPPVIGQVFGAASIPFNGSTSLTFTVQNNNTTTTLTGIGFTETLPAGLVISTPNGQAGTAGGGTITATQGTNVITVTGATLAQSSSFTFSVNVTGIASGAQNATTGTVTSTEGGTGLTASASINVIPVVTLNTTNLPISQTSLVINGSGFSTTAANNLVVFNDGAVGTVTSSTATSLTVAFSTQPAAIGSLTAVVTTNGQSSGVPVQVATVITDLDLAITCTDGATTAVPGSTTTYTIVVTNNGPTAAPGAVIADTFPATFTSVHWTAVQSGGATGFAASGTGTISATATMPPGSIITYTAVGTLNASATGSVANTATVTAPLGYNETNPANNSATDTDTLTPQADVAVSVSAPATVNAGANLVYSITVTNNGPSDALSVSLSDTLPSGTTFVSFVQNTGPTFGTTFAPGASATATLTLSVSAGITNGTVLGNLTVVTATTTDPNNVNNSATTNTTVTTSADLQVGVTGPASATAGTNASYAITVTNNGPSNATAVSLADLLPVRTSLVSLVQNTGPSFTISGSGATLATMNAGATATFTLTVSVPANAANASTLSNEASVSETTSDPSGANNKVTTNTPVVTSADLAVTVVDAPDPVVAGTNLTYTISAINNGPSDAQNVSITDVLPSGLTFVSLTTQAGWSNTTPAVGAGGTVTMTIPTLALGASATFTLTVAVDPSVASGSNLNNTATIASATTDPTPGNSSATATTAVTATADLSITLTDGKAFAIPGTSETYTIVVSNAGPSTATGATVADVFPAALTGVAYTVSATGGATGASNGSGNINSTVTMPPGSTITFTATGTINAGATGSLVDTATVSAPVGTTDPAPGNNSATDTDLLNHPPVPTPVTLTRYPTQSVKIAVTDLLTHVTDADVGDTVSITAVSGGSHGAPTLANGFVYYVPNAGDANGDVFTYTATDNHGVSANSTITVNIITDNSPSMNITFRGVQPDGSVSLDFSGIPGHTYGLQFSTDLVHWTTIKSVTTDQYGSGHVVDAPAHVTPSGFYRMIYPYTP